MKTLLKKLLLGSVSLLVSLGAAEATYRWWQAPDENAPDGTDHEWRRRYNRLNETLYMRSEDPTLIYEPRPDSEVEMEYGIARFNAAGMRQEAVPNLAPDERIRVAIVGDSIVWTEFLELEHTLPTNIGNALGEDYEVLNFGVSGYDTVQEAVWYRQKVRPYRPAIVAVVFCMNDMMIMSGPYERHATEAEKERKHAQDRLLDARAPVRSETLNDVLARDEERATFRFLSRLSGHARRFSFARNYVDEYLVMLGEPEKQDAFRAAIDDLGEAIRADGARPVFVISPILDSWGDYHWSPIHTVVSLIAQSAGFEVIDPLEAWREEHDPEDLRIGGDHIHYNRTGNTLFGEVIAEAIRSPRGG